MKGLNPKKQSALFQNNCKTHFKMYKAGRRWLIAGISILSGLLGGSALTATTAKAQTLTPGAGQQVAPEDVTATQTSMTIPATSQSASEVAQCRDDNECEWNHVSCGDKSKSREW
ncbi:KxYKxGKxW signal peptide domain-containing protein [Levilactobacillus zymae]|uniref:KxYKxGKxW signal peptide domain-containing protein n=1 Tax=Levilactobacillus zymae TaxID=267363 RepID=UPI003FCD9911